jgi:hypothetical protein
MLLIRFKLVLELRLYVECPAVLKMLLQLTF